MIDLNSLPRPQVIEPLDFEALFSAFAAAFATAWGEARARDPSLPAYDVDLLETDPVVVIGQAWSYLRLLDRARVNDAARANLVAFSGGSDLDHLAAFYDVTRLDGETDEGLRARVVIAISGRSTAGPADWYRAAAMRASPRVRDAKVYRVGKGPELRIAVLATDNFGEPDAALLKAVDLIVQSDAVRPISDRIEVVSAVTASVDVTADIWLLPTAPQAVFDNLEAMLRQALADEGRLGFDVVRSWLIARLQQPGVHKVVLTSPAADIVVGDNAAAKLGTVTLNYRGRDR